MYIFGLTITDRWKAHKWQQWLHVQCMIFSTKSTGAITCLCYFRCKFLIQKRIGTHLVVKTYCNFVIPIQWIPLNKKRLFRIRIKWRIAFISLAFWVHIMIDFYQCNTHALPHLLFNAWRKCFFQWFFSFWFVSCSNNKNAIDIIFITFGLLLVCLINGMKWLNADYCHWM